MQNLMNDLSSKRKEQVNVDKNKKSSQVAGTTSEGEVKVLLHVIEQGMQSILIRDKYIRVLSVIQLILLILIFLK